MVTDEMSTYGSIEDRDCGRPDDFYQSRQGNIIIVGVFSVAPRLRQLLEAKVSQCRNVITFIAQVKEA